MACPENTHIFMGNLKKKSTKDKKTFQYITEKSQSWRLLHQKSRITVLRTANQRKQQIHCPLTYLVLLIKKLLE